MEQETTTRDLIGFYYDEAKRLSRYADQDWAPLLAKKIAHAREAGVSSEDIKAGLTLLLMKGLQPSSLSSAILEQQAKQTKPTRKAECPECGLRFFGPRSVAEHLHNIHGYPHPDD